MICAGRRSRKSLISKRKIIEAALSKPNQKLFHAAPAFTQAKNIFWEDLKRDTRLFWANRPSETDLRVTLINGSEISVQSLDRAFRLEGTPWNGFHLTEYPNAKPQIWDANLRPLLADTKGFAIIDGVPDMQSPLAGEYRAMAKRACGGPIPRPEPKKGAFAENEDWCFYSWLSSDVLDENEIKELKATTDPKIYAQEWEGSFETLAGRVYYGFNWDYYPNGNLDKTVAYNKELPIILAFDFNVDPMTATLSHFIIANDGPNKGKKEVHTFKEYCIKDSNTKELTTRILTEYPDTKVFYVTTCHSGEKRQTSQNTGKTDRVIIGDIMKQFNRMCKFNHRSRNPYVVDKINASNGMLYHNRVRINPDCKELINDYELLCYKKGTSDIDDSDKMRGHSSDGMGYELEFYFPVRNSNTGPAYNKKVII